MCGGYFGGLAASRRGRTHSSSTVLLEVFLSLQWEFQKVGGAKFPDQLYLDQGRSPHFQNPLPRCQQRPAEVAESRDRDLTAADESKSRRPPFGIEALIGHDTWRRAPDKALDGFRRLQSNITLPSELQPMRKPKFRELTGTLADWIAESPRIKLTCAVAATS